ncbi:MAG TPA: 50S ribosomal protein L9 [Polyangiaceae bacterium]|jgi:large subunit ribosomal protein L9
MATPIRVLLCENVDQLGNTGDVVRVRPGFARNYLIPRGLATFATAGNLARIDELRRAAQARADGDTKAAFELKQKLEASGVRIERAVGDEGKMYGSVTAKDVAEAFGARGLAFDRKKLSLSEPIRTLGVTEVALKLSTDITASLKVEVVKKS